MQEKKKIVVLDGFTVNSDDLSWDELGALGDLTVYDRTSQTDEQEVIARIGDAELVYTKKVPITKNIIDACPSVKFINMLATGYNIIDVAYAKEKGIPVANIPTYGSAAVSQYAIALMLEACLHIGHHSETVHAGKWENNIDWCYWDYPLIELDGKTLGILGLGKIGTRTAATAGALGMKVLAYDPYPTNAGRAVAVLSRFLTDFSEDELREYVSRAYAPEKFPPKAVAPVVSLDENAHILELFHGPTCAFKDMALQLLPHLLTVAASKTAEGKTIVILVATSGDTGCVGRV